MSVNNVVLKSNYADLLGKHQEVPFELASDGFEVLTFSSPTSRQSLSIVLNSNNNSSSTSRNDVQIHITANDGYVYLTTKRFVFITASLGDINTFLIDVNLAPVIQLSHQLKSPWFGANYWEFIFFSPANLEIAANGFPKNQYFKGQLKFNDGGLFGFIEKFNVVLNDAVNNSHIDDQLPLYSEI